MASVVAMCGVAGFVSFNRRIDNAQHILESMLQTISHRGPDAVGTFADNFAFLGVNRLSIVDLDERATQPMRSASHVICFNGEIYNHVDLRKELISAGVQFKTTSDTEVVLELFKREGPRCLAKLRGMFAFIVWDAAERKLFAARDRIGEKPLVYFYDQQRFAFASEIAALTRYPGIPRTIETEAILQSLVYSTSPPPQSCFKSIKKLPPAHYLVLTERGMDIQRYWSAKVCESKMIQNRWECEAALEDQMDETIGLVSRADVPVGLSLSGGIDSGAVAIFAAKLGISIHSFTVGIGDDPDSKAARIVARDLGLAHHPIDPPQLKVDLFHDIAKHFGEPVMSPGIIHSALLARGVKGVVKVALGGSGSDEVFGGYAGHYVMRKIDSYPKFLETAFRLGIDVDVEKLKEKSNVDRWINEHAGPGGTPRRFLSAEMTYGRLWMSIQQHCTESFLSSGESPLNRMARIYDESGTFSLLDSYILQHIQAVSVHSLVDIPDAMSMMHSIENRNPFLDHKMIELALRIPGKFKVTLSKQSKSVLRNVVERRLKHLPDSKKVVLDRPKTSFGEPLNYFAREDVRDYLRNAIESVRLKEVRIFKPEFLERMRLCLLAGLPMSPEEKHLLWAAGATSTWLDEFKV